MTAQRLSGFPLLISIRGACHRNLTFDIRGAALFKPESTIKGFDPCGSQKCAKQVHGEAQYLNFGVSSQAHYFSLLGHLIIYFGCRLLRNSIWSPGGE